MRRLLGDLSSIYRGGDSVYTLQHYPSTMSLYDYVLRYISSRLAERTVPTVPSEPRAPIGFLGLYGRYAYIHDTYPTVLQILNVNLLHDHFSGRRVMSFKLGVIEVWAFNPDTRDAIPLSVFGVPISYVPMILPRLREEGYRLVAVEHVYQNVTVPEENVYNLEHVCEGIGDTLIIDKYGMFRKTGASLPPEAQMRRLLETESEVHRLRLILTNMAIQYRKVIQDYTVLRETVDRLREIVDTLYTQLESLMSRCVRLEAEVTRLSEEVKLRRSEALIHRTVSTYREMQTMTLAAELPAKIRDLRSEMAGMMELLRSLREEVEKIRTAIPQQQQAQTTTPAPTPTAGTFGERVRRLFKTGEGGGV